MYYNVELAPCAQGCGLLLTFVSVPPRQIENKSDDENHCQRRSDGGHGNLLVNPYAKIG